MNALLEGDVAPRRRHRARRRSPSCGRARKRTRVGSIELAAGRALETEHEALDATRLNGDLDAALERLACAGCTAIAVSGAFAVDDPSLEETVAERARARGLPVCAGHELTGTYGLETRTVSAAINASILPVVERDGRARRGGARARRPRVPLLVLRGDGGAMSVDGVPAPAVAHRRLRARPPASPRRCTSSRVSRRDRDRVRRHELERLGREGRAAGAADASRDGPADVHPRDRQLGRRRRRRQPRAPAGPQDRRGRAAERARRGAALRVLRRARPSCGRRARARRPARGRSRAVRDRSHSARPVRADDDVRGERARSRRRRRATRRARRRRRCSRSPRSAARLRTTTEEAARRVLEDAAKKIAHAVREAARQHELGDDVPLVALGGAGEALVGEVARLLGRDVLRPRHPEVLSSIGAALSLVRAEATRSAVDSAAAAELAREAERACVAAGAAPATVAVETAYDAKHRLMRAVATGAVALETGAADARAGPDRRAARARRPTRSASRSTASTLLAANDFYRVYSENGSGRVAVVDELGVVPDRRGRAAGSSPARARPSSRGSPTSCARARATSASPRCFLASCSCAARASSTSPTRGAQRRSSLPPSE